MMSYHDKQMKQEINAVLDSLSDRHEPWKPQWITHEICDSHSAGLRIEDTIHVAFHVYTSYTQTRKIVTECINDRADPPIGRETVSPQLPLPGFARKHLQDYYVVEREDGQVAVCVLDLTNEEIDAKAALYRSHARKAIAHAEELERFRDWRLAKAS